MAVQSELEIVLRFKDLMTKGLGKAQRAMLRLTALGTKGFKAMTGALGRMKNALLGLPGLIAAVATGGLAHLARGFIDAASDAEETANKFAVAMGTVNDAAMEVATTISEDMGRGLTQIQGSMANFQSLLVSQGFGEQAALDASTALTQLSIDLASFENVSDERASNALRSALLGEAEALKQLNIFVRDGALVQEALNLGIIDTKRELSEAEKITARYSIIMRSNTLAHGDAARTMDGFANSSRMLKSQVEALRVEFGQELIVAVTEAMQELGGTAVVLEVVRSGFELVVGITKEFIKGGVQAVQFIQRLNMAMEETGGRGRTLGNIFNLVGGLIQTAFSAAAVVATGFEQGIDVVVLAVRTLWEVLKLLSAALAYVVLELIQTGTRAWGLFAQGINWVINVIRDGLLVVIDRMADGLVNLLQTLRAALAFVAANTPVAAEKFMGMVHSIDAAVASVQGFNGAVQQTPQFTGLDNFIQAADNATVRLGVLQDSVVAFMSSSLGNIQTAGSEFVDDILRDAEGTKAALNGLWEGLERTGMASADVASDMEAVLAGLEEFNANGTLTTDTAEVVAESLGRLSFKGEELAETLAGLSGGDGNGGALGNTQSSLQKLMEDAQDMELQMDRLGVATAQNFAGGLASAFTDVVTGAKSAKEAFKDFALQFIAQTIRMIAQMLILRALSFGFGFADGGVIPGGSGEFQPVQGFANGGVISGGMGSPMPVHGYADGGPFYNKPHMAVIGEGRYNEAVVPLPDGRRIPVEMRGGGGGDASINFNIQANDARGFDQLLTERRATIEDVIANGMATRRGFRTTMKGEFS